MWSFPDCGSLIDHQASKKSRSLKLGSCPTTLTVLKYIFVGVFVCVSGDPGVMVEHSNRPFIRTVQNYSWYNWFSIMRQILGDEHHSGPSDPETNCSQFSTVCRPLWSLLGLRWSQSFPNCLGHKEVPRSQIVDRLAVLIAISCSCLWRMMDSCSLPIPYPLASFLCVSLSVLKECYLLFETVC